MNNLKKENWFWCDVCECVSYDFDCECRSTSCNCTGCDKCRPSQKIIDRLHKNHSTPTKEECIENNIKRWGSIETPETKILKEIFGE